MQEAGIQKCLSGWHQLGSKAKFVGVTWDGNTAPDYHEAVYRAFRTSEHVGSALNKYTNLTIAAHSLGNKVISNAIENHGFDPDRYFMLNAATPIEAYNITQISNSSGNVDMTEHMTEHDWKPYDDKLFAANWYHLFLLTAKLQLGGRKSDGGNESLQM